MTLKLNERYPGRFNNPSSDYPQGSFKNRTAPSAKDGSYLEQDWANDKEGFFQSMISKAALAPNGLVDKVGSSQLFNALIRLIQNQEGVAYTTTGASGTFVITPSPAVPSYSLYLRLQVVFNAAGGANPTINISGLGAKSLKQYNSSGVKIPAVISSGQSSDIFYDGTDVVVLDQLPNSTGVTAPQFDNSLNLATTAWVRGVGNRYSSIAVATTTYTVTVANAGGLVLGNAASLFNAVLPSAAALPAGETITIYCYGAGGMQVYVAGADTINFPPSIVTDFLVVQGMSITLGSNGINAWYVTSQNGVGATPIASDSSTKYATTAFVSRAIAAIPKNTATFTASGFSKNADTGEIIQWMEVLIGDIPAGGKTMNITWPFAFPNAIVNVPSISLRSADALTRHVSAVYYSAATVNGCTLQIDEAAQVVQPASLTAIVTARGR